MKHLWIIFNLLIFLVIAFVNGSPLYQKSGISRETPENVIPVSEAII